MQFSYVYRGGYDWNLSATEDDFANSPNVYDRYYATGIQIQTFLFDLILKPSVNWGGFVPYVKGGIGAAYNKIGAVKNVDVAFAGRPVSFNTRLDGASTTSFAWDAGVGANYYFNQKFSVGLGYRFVDVGKLQTSDIYHNLATGLTSTVSPFVAEHVFLNEVTISAAYHFNLL